MRALKPPLKLFAYRPDVDFQLSPRFCYIPLPLILDTPAEGSKPAAIDPSRWRFHAITHDWRNNALWENYRHDPALYQVTQNPIAADYFVFPYLLDELIETLGVGGVSAALRRLPYFTGNEKRHLFMTLHDSSEPFRLESLIYRASVRRTQRDPGTSALPYAVEDCCGRTHFDLARVRFDVSFAGFTGCPVSGPVRRRLIASLANAKGLRTFVSPSDRFHGRQPGRLREERRELFLNSMADSWLVACPRGAGANTYRFFETLSMGRIPVLLSDDCVLPFEDRIAYDSFILRIPEKDAGRTADILTHWLRSQTTGQLLERCRLARRAWEEHLDCRQWVREIASDLRRPDPLQDRCIVIDGVIFQLQGRKPYGISRLWQALLTELGKSRTSRRLLMLDRAGTAPAIEGIERRRIAPFRLGEAPVEAERLDAFCREERAGLFLSTYYTYTRQTPSLLMLYDMIPERMRAAGPEASNPEWHDKHAAILNSSAFAAISESSARDFERFYPKPAAGSPAAVIPCAVAEGFSRPEPERIEAFCRSRGIGRPYFLLMGRRDAHKNLGLFFEAFARLEDRERYAIVMAGGRAELDPAFRRLAGGAEIHQGFFPEEELPSLYGGALALVYPSRYEGFGLPLLEAMRCGCPVITCHNSSLFEVARHAALYVGEDDETGLAKALADVQQPEVRDYLIRSGCELSRNYSWARSAERLEAVIKGRLAAGRGAAAALPEGG